MANKANKKQRHEAKRKAKRLTARRRDSISPVKRLSDSKGEVECWASGDFSFMRQLQIFAYKRAGGLNGVACFLVDQGVVGLKDSWVRLDMDRPQLQEMLNVAEGRGITMRRIEVEEARRWIAGGARWAYDNGMRLPRDWLKHTSVIGGVLGWQNADVSAFTMNFAGHPEDLRQRLIRETLESYLKRDDIQFTFSMDAPYKDQRTGEYAPELNSDAFDDDESDDESDEQFESPDDGASFEVFKKLTHRLDIVAATLVSETQKWLATRNEMASPELAEAWKSVITSTLLAKSTLPDANEQEVSELSGKLLFEAIRLIEPARLVERKRATDQALEHLETNSLIIQNAIKMLALPEGTE